MAAAAEYNDIFEKYAKFGKTEAQIKEMKGGLRIEQRNVQKLFKESGVLTAKYTAQLLDNDMARVLGKLIQADPSHYPKGSKTFDKGGFGKLIDQVAESTKQDAGAVVAKLNSVSGPSTAGTTGVANAANVARMTDTSQYTGAHKERFDESGKGKGVDGREDRHDNSGYVGNYKGANTYDKTH